MKQLLITKLHYRLILPTSDLMVFESLRSLESCKIYLGDTAKKPPHRSDLCTPTTGSL